MSGELTEESAFTQKADALELCELRMKDLSEAQNHLAMRAEFLGKQSTRSRYALIILGATVAVKGVVDQLMLTYKAPSSAQMILDVLFTVVGLSISVIAWLQDAFNPTWKATGLRELAIKASGYKRQLMSMVHFASDSDDLEIVVGRFNDCLEELYSGASAYGVNLSREIRIDYSVISGRRP